MTDAERGSRAPVLPSQRFALQRLGAPRLDGAAVYLRRAPLDELIFAAGYAPDRLQAAVLVGTVGPGDPASFVEIAGYADLDAWPNDTALVRAWLDDQIPMRRRVERMGAGMTLVGHAIVRPGAGSRPTAADERLHRTFLNLPWQVTVLIDPQDRTVGVWGVDPDGALINVGFNLVTPRRDGAPDADASDETPGAPAPATDTEPA